MENQLWTDSSMSINLYILLILSKNSKIYFILLNVFNPTVELYVKNVKKKNKCILTTEKLKTISFYSIGDIFSFIDDFSHDFYQSNQSYMLLIL